MQVLSCDDAFDIGYCMAILDCVETVFCKALKEDVCFMNNSDVWEYNIMQEAIATCHMIVISIEVMVKMANKQ